MLGLMVASPAPAADLYKPDGWSALASDRIARGVGDSLTVLVYENAVASNSAQNASRKDNRIAGDIRVGSALDETAGIGLSGRFDATGETGRAGRMVAQLSVVVDRLLPNGDLHVSGDQALKINGERTTIRLSGRVRADDISAANTVLSSRIAEAAIDYDGNGFVSKSAGPGIVTRIFRFLGLL